MLVGVGLSSCAASQRPDATEPASLPTNAGDDGIAPGDQTANAQAEVDTHPTAPQPVASIRPLTADEVAAAQLTLIEAPDCPVGFDQLIVVEAPFVDFGGEDQRGTLIVNRDVAEDVAGVFEQLYAARFQIQRMDAIDPLPVDATDRTSSNNTVAFNCRAVRGGSSWSQHAYGHAVDINPVDNPSIADGAATPPLGIDRIDRTLREPGMIHEGDEVTQAFDALGWGWGGRWTSHQDHMHFSVTGG